MCSQAGMRSLGLMFVVAVSLAACGSSQGTGGGNGSGGGGGGGGGGGAPGAESTDSGSSAVVPPGSAPGSHPPSSVDAGSAALHIALDETSVSGLSSGAFMAVQVHVAFSSIMKGAAIFAGGPFYCAQASEGTATTTCMSSTTAPDIAPYVAITKQYAASGDIDDPSNLASQRVFLFGGADDHTVDPVVMDSLNSYYATYMSPASIQYVNRRPGTSHTMPTVSYGTSCDESVPPYIGSCSYDGAGLALQQIYGTLAAPSTSPTGTLVPLSQAQFVSDPSSHSLANDAYVYLPASCAAGETCRIHVAFHGCEQNAATVGSDFYAHAGYNAWADTNHIVVLYPQTTAGGTNYEGCWDWYGYDSPSYATKNGPQMAAVKAMIDYLANGGPLTPGATAGATDAGASSSLPTGIAGFDASFGLPTATCVTDTNYDHVLFGRAHATNGNAFANGSNDALGADTELVVTSLKEQSSGYYVMTTSCF